MADKEKPKKEEEKGEGEEPAAAKPKGKKKLIIILAAVLVLAGGGGAFALMGGKSAAPGEDEEHAQEQEKHYATFPLDTIIVNLADNASFLKTKMTIEYDPEIMLAAGGGGGGGGHGGGGAGGGEKSGLPPQIAHREPMIRDAIIRVLSSKTATEVLSVEGKEAIKEELIEAINEAIGFDEGPIVNVYFNEYIVQ